MSETIHYEQPVMEEGRRDYYAKAREMRGDKGKPVVWVQRSFEPGVPRRVDLYQLGAWRGYIEQKEGTDTFSVWHEVETEPGVKGIALFTDALDIDAAAAILQCIADIREDEERRQA